MNKPLSGIVLAAILAASPARAQEEHQHSHGGEAEQFGTVHFPASCSADVIPEFTLAVAQLHSFDYEESRRSFEDVVRKDPRCAIAYWGIAMTYYHPIWAAPGAEDLAAGGAAASKAAEIGAKTERENAYIGAIVVFYRDSDRVGARRPREGLQRRDGVGVAPVSRTTTRRRSSTPCRCWRRRRRLTRRTPTRRRRPRS